MANDILTTEELHAVTERKKTLSKQLKEVKHILATHFLAVNAKKQSECNHQWEFYGSGHVKEFYRCPLCDAFKIE